MISTNKLERPDPELTDIHTREKSNRYVVTQTGDGIIEYEKRNLWQCNVRSDMFDIGVAPSLYFYLYISLGVCLLINAILAIPQVVFSSLGDMIISDVKHVFSGSTMLANLGTMPDLEGLLNDERLDAIQERSVDIKSNSLDIRGVTTGISVLDGVAVFVFLLGAHILYRWTIPVFVKKYDWHTMRITDHSVALLNLPSILLMNIHPSRYVKVLTDHFVALCNENPTFAHKVRAEEDILQDIVVIRNYHGNFNTMYKLAKLREQVILDQVRKERGLEASCMDKIKGMFKSDPEKKKKKLTNRLLQHYSPAHEADVIMAFLTFKRSDDKNFIQDLYSRYNSSLTYAYQPKNLRLLQTYRFRVQDAPEPEDVLWENLDYPIFKKKVWIVVVWIISLSLIVLFGVIRWALYEPSKDLKEPPKLPTFADYALLEVSGSSQMNICDIQFYSDHQCIKPIISTTQVPYWNQSKKRITATQYVWDVSGKYCHKQQFRVDDGRSTSGVVVGLGSFQSPKCVRFTQTDDQDSIVEDVSVHLCSIAGDSTMSTATVGKYDNFLCTRMMNLKSLPKPSYHIVQVGLTDFYRYPTSVCADTDAKSATLDQMQTFAMVYPDQAGSQDEDIITNDWYSYCWCTRHMIHGYKWDRCKDINIHRIASMGFAALISIIVHISNSILKKIIRGMTGKERHRCNSDRLRSNYIKIFLCLFANQALVDLIINARYKAYNGENHSSAEINSGWYLDVGEQVMTTVFTYIFLPHLLKILKLPYHFFIKTRPSKVEKCVTQYDAYNLKEPIEFKIDVKLATLMSFIGFILMYGPALPLVYFIAMIVLFVRYWTDKAELIHTTMARGTDQYLFNLAALSMPFLVMCHSAIAYFIYGNPLTVPSFRIDRLNDMYKDQILDDLDKNDPGGAISYLMPSFEGFFTASFWKKIPGYMNSSALTPGIIFVGMLLTHILGFLFLIILLVGSSREVISKVNKLWPQYGYDDDIKFKLTYANLVKERRLTSYRISENPEYADVALIMRDLDEQFSKAKSKTTLIDKLLNRKFKFKRHKEEYTSSDSYSY